MMDTTSLVHNIAILVERDGGANPDQLHQAYASYRPSFMEIKLPFSFQGDFDSLSEHDFGVMLHEYVHYLQNLSTPWGLYSSMVEYAELVETYRTIQESSEGITIPMKPVLTEKLKRQRELIISGDGFNPFNEDGCLSIDRSVKVSAYRRIETVGGKRTTVITCKVQLSDGRPMEFVLGSKIIKESMAGMIQQLVDPSAIHDNFDIPYNIIRIVCEDMFPEVATDPVKMITVCYMSLFSMSPAQVLFDELDNANRNMDLSAKDLLDLFMENSRITMNGNRYRVYEFYGMLKNKFVEVLERVLTIDATYIREALSRADVSKGYIPLLSILYGDGISRERVVTLMNGIGFPWVWTEDGIVNSVINGNESLGSPDVNLLVCHNAIYSYLCYPNQWRCCPLRHLCLKGVIGDDECWEEKPWEGRTCIMNEMANWLGLDKKTIKIYY